MPDIFVSLLPLLTIPLVLLVHGDNAIVVYGSASWPFHQPPSLIRGLTCLTSCSPCADIRRLSHHLDPFCLPFPPSYVHLSQLSTPMFPIQLTLGTAPSVFKDS